MDLSNLVLLRGKLSSEPVVRHLQSGARLVQLNVTTAHPEGGRSVPLAWFDPPASASARMHAGVEVVVAGYVKRRFFRGGGVTQSRTEVVVEQLVQASRERAVERLLGSAASRLGAARLDC